MPNFQKAPPLPDLARWATWRALNDFNYFCTWLTTKDEAIGKKAPWPVDLDYLKVIGDILPNSKVLWVPKSRRMMLTWTMCAYLLWKAMSDEVFHGFIQSTKEEKADDILQQRVKFLWDHLPYWMKFYAFGSKTHANWRYTRGTLPNGAVIQAVAQGPEQFAQYTPSLIFVDEAAKQQEAFRSTYTTIVPFVEKQTQLFFVSSVEQGFFFETSMNSRRSREKVLLRGNPCLPPERRKGMALWTLEHGGDVLMVHYSADPNKDDKWLAAMDQDVAGGVESDDWRREMEIDGSAFAGQPIYPMWSEDVHVIEDIEPPENAKKYLTMDYGYRNPSAVLWVYESGEREYTVWKELYVSGVSIERLKELIWLESIDPRGIPYHFEAELIDPSTDAVREGDSYTFLHMFNNGDYKRTFRKARNRDDGIAVIREWLWDGRLKVCESCKGLRFEFPNYRHQELSDALRSEKNPKEKPRKKDDHALDALKYLANHLRIFSVFVEPEKEADMSEVEQILERIESASYWITEGSEPYDPPLTLDGLMRDF